MSTFVFLVSTFLLLSVTIVRFSLQTARRWKTFGSDEKRRHRFAIAILVLLYATHLYTCIPLFLSLETAHTRLADRFLSHLSLDESDKALDMLVVETPQARAQLQNLEIRPVSWEFDGPHRGRVVLSDQSEVNFIFDVRWEWLYASWKVHWVHITLPGEPPILDIDLLSPPSTRFFAGVLFIISIFLFPVTISRRQGDQRRTL